MTESNQSLAGQLLIAMPGLADPNFWQSVVLLGVHSDDEGAFGLVINRSLELDIDDVLEELGEGPAGGDPTEVLAGGPVQPGHGFVLFERGEATPDADDIPISTTLIVSGNTKTLTRLAHSHTRRFSLLLGYSGWYPGQLEREIEENSWVVAPLDNSIIFDVPVAERWNAALRSIGVDPGTLVDSGASQPS